MNFVGKRLEALRERLTLNWGELAEHIGMSRSMLDFVRNGLREPSPKLLRKIETAEREAGIQPPETSHPKPSKNWTTTTATSPTPGHVHEDPAHYGTADINTAMKALEAIDDRCKEQQRDIVKLRALLEAMKEKEKGGKT